MRCRVVWGDGMGGVDGWNAWGAWRQGMRGIHPTPRSALYAYDVLESVNCTPHVAGTVVLEYRYVRGSEAAPRWLTTKCAYVCAV